MIRFALILILCCLTWLAGAERAGAAETGPGSGDAADGDCDCASGYSTNNGDMAKAYFSGLGSGVVFGYGLAVGLGYLNCRYNPDAQCGLAALYGIALMPYFAARGIHWYADAPGVSVPRGSTILYSYLGMLAGAIAVSLSSGYMADNGYEVAFVILFAAALPVSAAAGGLYGYANAREPAGIRSGDAGFSMGLPQMAVIPVKTSEYREMLYLVELVRYYF